jgi:FkbM family methyltransferase
MASESCDILVAHEYMAVKKCRHGTFLFNRNDALVGQSMERYGEWCESEIQLLDQVIRPGFIVVDVGANIGTHSVPMATKVGDSGRVYSFEPQRHVFQMLCANVAMNALRNVLTYQNAVADRKSTIRIPVIDPRRKYNFAAVSMKEHTAGEEVVVIDIDSLQLHFCNLIKIDVEGMETLVLNGARSTIERFRPVLFVENNTLERSREIIETVHSLGYRAYWHLANYYNSGNYFGNDVNIFAGFRPEANLLCIHDSLDANINGLRAVAGLDDNWIKATQRRPELSAQSLRPTK